MFFDRIGKTALGSRLRMLSERVTDDSKKIYELYDIELKPKWFPVFYVLSEDGASCITDIADEIGHSHPSVVKIVKEMAKSGIVTEKKDRNDGRKNLIELTAKGRELAVKIEDQYQDVTCAIDDTLKQTCHNIWNAMEELEYLLNQKSLFVRVREEKKRRESEKVGVVTYEPRYRENFRRLNEEWITTYFRMEEGDHRTLGDPDTHILDAGGHILVALYEEEPVGVCALIKQEGGPYDFELAKMAVSPKVQGKGIGWLLGKATVEKAWSVGAKKIYLESNTLLKPAIRLYEKLGFKKISRDSSYERCNIQMEVVLHQV